MIYLLEYQKLNDDQFERLVGFMPTSRLEKFGKYKFRKDKELALLSYGLLCYALKAEHGIDPPIELLYEKYGKPYLANNKDVHFNISHCKLGVACILSDSPCGIDIEEIRPYNEALAKKVCSESELALLEQSDNKPLDFCKIWTCKESILKRNGTGIYEIKRELDKSETLSHIYDNYVVSSTVLHSQKLIICNLEWILPSS